MAPPASCGSVAPRKYSGVLSNAEGLDLARHAHTLCTTLLRLPPCRVVANILRGPLIELAPRLAAYARPGAALALSGVLEEQTPAVIEAYAPWFQDFEVATEERWALVTAVRRQAG